MYYTSQTAEDSKKTTRTAEKEKKKGAEKKGNILK